LYRFIAKPVPQRNIHQFPLARECKPRAGAGIPAVAGMSLTPNFRTCATRITGHHERDPSLLWVMARRPNVRHSRASGNSKRLSPAGGYTPRALIIPGGSTCAVLRLHAIHTLTTANAQRPTPQGRGTHSAVQGCRGGTALGGRSVSTEGTYHATEGDRPRLSLNGARQYAVCLLLWRGPVCSHIVAVPPRQYRLGALRLTSKDTLINLRFLLRRLQLFRFLTFCRDFFAESAKSHLNLWPDGDIPLHLGHAVTCFSSIRFAITIFTSAHDTNK
jgi:hypothetical protein